MTQTSNRFFDEIGRLMNDAAGAAQGVKREEFDAVKDMQARNTGTNQRGEPVYSFLATAFVPRRDAGA